MRESRVYPGGECFVQMSQAQVWGGVGYSWRIFSRVWGKNHNKINCAKSTGVRQPGPPPFHPAPIIDCMQIYAIDKYTTNIQCLKNKRAKRSKAPEP